MMSKDRTEKEIKKLTTTVNTGSDLTSLVTCVLVPCWRPYFRKNLPTLLLTSE